MPYTLQLQNLYCAFDDEPLFSSVSFELQAGDVCRVHGPNGAGKTTLLRTLAGLFGGYSGEYRFGVQVNSIRYLGHKSGIRDELTALENLAFLTEYKFDELQLLSALKAVGLFGYEYNNADELSAGQRRRILLSTLFCAQYDLILLDEPYTALDVDGVALISRHIKSLAEEGATIVYTTHHADTQIDPSHTVELRPVK